MPSGCNVCNSRIHKLSLFCLWFSFQLRLWSMILILICQSYPSCAPATQGVDPRARASFSQGHGCVYSFFCWMVGHFLLRIVIRRRDSQGGKPHYEFYNWHCKRSYTPFLSSCYGTPVRVAIGDSTCNACHHMAVGQCKPCIYQSFWNSSDLSDLGGRKSWGLPITSVMPVPMSAKHFWMMYLLF